MSVMVTLRMSGDATTFEQAMAAHTDAVGRIME